ncbi:ABC transporter ATP-binding protein [Clostridium sp.]|uniref:ABC transporter ATP-binding protein n=1 Tax=Clostridium sp. TaxID=1506 RepID=UPI001A5437E8|nr:ABC transporter ATP-binding protein [Clostridium sp.]MBK5241159.1 ABC transporter ATP-binding protein [Clostridium sp.]
MNKERILPEGVVLRLENLSIAFGGLKAVDNLSFDIKENEIFGLIGPNGAGKTTAFNCITQFYKPDSGNIYFRDRVNNVQNLLDHQVHEIIKLGLVRTFQNVELIRELSILDNVLVGGHIDFKASIFEQALKLPRALREEKVLREEAISILKSLELEERKDMIVAGQPYGILKKVELARTLMCKPKLIILDEPAAGLNDIETLQLTKMIRKIRDEFNCSVLLVEHDMRLVMDVCDRVCAISFGRFLAIGTTVEIQQNKDVQAAYLGNDGDE